MKKSIKKLLTLVLSAVILLGILTGCGNETPKQTEPANNTPDVPTVSGMLVLSTAASLKITYDSEGMVMNVTGSNDDGVALANAYEYLGKSCSTAIKDLIAASAEAGYLSGNVKNIVLKLAVGSSLPTELFLDVLASDAEAAAKEAGSSAVVTAIGLDGLDEDGYINAEIAKTLLLNELGVDQFESISGSPAPVNDCYLFTVQVGGVGSSHSIDAITGLISDTNEEEIPDSNEYVDESDPEQVPEINENYEELYIEESENTPGEDIDVPITDETVAK